MGTHSIGSRVRPLVGAAILVAALLAGVLAAPRAAADDATPAADEASPAVEKLVLRGGWTNDPDNLNPFIGYESS